MRIIAMHKADKHTEAGTPPRPEQMFGIGKLMEDAGKAGVLRGGEGLRPSSERLRLSFAGGKATVTKGPYTGQNELFAGFAMLKVKSMDEAVEWATRFAEVVGGVEMELGPVTEAWDLGFCPKPEGHVGLRVLAMHKASPESESGEPPTPAQMAAMGKLIAQMTQAGVFIAAEGFAPSSKGVRLRFAGGKRSLIDGPFAESKELIAGYAIFEVSSLDEAVHWATRFAEVSGTPEIDLRHLG